MTVRQKVKIFLGLPLVFLTIFLAGCQSGPDFEALKAELMELHNVFIEAHKSKDIDFFTKDISDNYFTVGNGQIRRPSKEEITEQFTNYLNNTTFSEYRYLQDPDIGFSRDGSLAWMIEKIKVRGNRTTDDGSDREFDFICAWITLYERKGDKWIRLGEVSTFK